MKYIYYEWFSIHIMFNFRHLEVQFKHQPIVLMPMFAVSVSKCLQQTSIAKDMSVMFTVCFTELQ